MTLLDEKAHNDFPALCPLSKDRAFVFPTAANPSTVHVRKGSGFVIRKEN